jgi:hypothetical protein
MLGLMRPIAAPEIKSTLLSTTALVTHQRGRLVDPRSAVGVGMYAMAIQ